VTGPLRRGATFGDVLLSLSGAALFFALAWPWISNAILRSEADRVADEVASLRDAALQYRGVKGTWPPDGDPGAVPAELAPFVPTDLELVHPGHTLEWDAWETVTYPAPPTDADLGPQTSLDDPPRTDTLRTPPPVFGTVAGITVHTRDGRLLGLLQDRYGSERSFVRDSSWTLMLTPPDAGR
jgi:hypothetical protein